MTRFNPSDSEPNPISPTYPEGWGDLLIRYVLEDLSSDEVADVQQLLTEYPALEAEVAAYEDAFNTLPYGLEPQSPSTTLENRILQQATKVSRLQPPSQTSVSQNGQPLAGWRGRRRVWQGLGAVAALLLIAIGVDNYRLRRQVMQTTADNTELKQQVLTFEAALAQTQTQTSENEAILATLREPNALVYSLQGRGEAETASGSLLALPGQSEVVLVTHNLPVLSDNQIYRLWALETSVASPTYCGQFNNSDAGTARWQIPEALCSNTPAQMIITVDQISDPPVPKGPAVLQSSL